MRPEYPVDNSPTMFQLIFVSVLISLTLLVWLFMPDLPTDAEIATDAHLTYCEMVRLHKADPTIGWPDYKNIYDKECGE